MLQSPLRIDEGGSVAAKEVGRLRVMYQFSRAIYRELANEVLTGNVNAVCQRRQRLLSECESTVERLAADRHYFARPVRTLFNDIRALFPMSSQLRVYGVIEHHVLLAAEYVDSQAREGVTFDGSPLCCHATTRKGTSCQRVPLPGSKYCPSHKHLDDDLRELASNAA